MIDFILFPFTLILSLITPILVCFVLYWVVRLGVRHAIQDTRRI